MSNDMLAQSPISNYESSPVELIDDDILDDANALGDSVGAKRKSKRPPSTAERRATHNAIERARRESLNGRFLDLAHALPTMAHIKRPSKTAIVARSLEFVSEAVARENALASEVTDLKREVDELRARLGMPPRASSAYKSTSSAAPATVSSSPADNPAPAVPTAQQLLGQIQQQHTQAYYAAAAAAAAACAVPTVPAFAFNQHQAMVANQQSPRTADAHSSPSSSDLGVADLFGSANNASSAAIDIIGAGRDATSRRFSLASSGSADASGGDSPPSTASSASINYSDTSATAAAALAESQSYFASLAAFGFGAAPFQQQSHFAPEFFQPQAPQPAWPDYQHAAAFHLQHAPAFAGIFA